MAVPLPGVTVMVPSFTVGQLVCVAVAEPLSAGPAVTVWLTVPLHPAASVKVNVCGPTATPVNVAEACAGPPSIL